MSTEAVVMMLVAMLVLWGGLGLAIVRLVRRPDTDESPEAARRIHRDL